MELQTFPIKGPKLIRPIKLEDARGFFSELFSQEAFESAVGKFHFVQDNLSLSRPKGVVRGLHFQAPPYEQGKLIRVSRGAVMDVAVDIRRSSPTYGKYISAILTHENWTQLWIPPGFAHGFCTLEPDTEVAYKVTAPYSPEHDLGLAWDDPNLGIPWPVPSQAAVLSEKDRCQPKLTELHTYFP